MGASVNTGTNEEYAAGAMKHVHELLTARIASKHKSAGTGPSHMLRSGMGAANRLVLNLFRVVTSVRSQGRLCCFLYLIL